MHLQRVSRYSSLPFIHRHFSHALCRSPNLDQQKRVNALQRHFHHSSSTYSWSDRFGEGNIAPYFYQSASPLLTPSLVDDISGRMHRTFHFYTQQGKYVPVLFNTCIPKQPIGPTTSKEGVVSAKLHVNEEGPARGLPSVIEFFTSKEGSVTPIQKRIRGYNEKGNLAFEKVYNAYTDLRSHTFWSYTSDGQLKEINTPQGMVKYSYDEKRNRIKEECVESGLVRYNKYDEYNRLIERKEVDQRGEERVWSYGYEDAGIKETPPSGRPILHCFIRGDEVRMEFPLLLSADRPLKEIMQQIYDLYPLQNVVKVTYNAHRQVIERMFPDRAVETRTYTPEGSLKQITAPSGRITTYKTDAQGRALSKRVFYKDGQVVDSIKYAYEGPLLVSETHKDGATFSYLYTQGQLTEQLCNGVLQMGYSYDSIGRKTQTVDWRDQTKPVVTCYRYDGPGPATREKNVERVESIEAVESVKKCYNAWHGIVRDRVATGNTEGDIVERYDHMRPVALDRDSQESVK